MHIVFAICLLHCVHFSFERNTQAIDEWHISMRQWAYWSIQAHNPSSLLISFGDEYPFRIENIGVFIYDSVQQAIAIKIRIDIGRWMIHCVSRNFQLLLYKVRFAHHCYFLNTLLCGELSALVMNFTHEMSGCKSCESFCKAAYKG